MKIVIGYPPNIDAIDAVFHVRRMGLKKLAFGYGETIYQPVPWDMAPDYLLHEHVHAMQQAKFGGVEAWWDRYLIDKQFRLEQEIEANQRQWKAFVESGASRPMRRSQLAWMVKSLSGPIYGHMITAKAAKREITNSTEEP